MNCREMSRDVSKIDAECSHRTVDQLSSSEPLQECSSHCIEVIEAPLPEIFEWNSGADHRGDFVSFSTFRAISDWQALHKPCETQIKVLALSFHWNTVLAFCSGADEAGARTEISIANDDDDDDDDHAGAVISCHMKATQGGLQKPISAPEFVPF